MRKNVDQWINELEYEIPDINYHMNILSHLLTN